MPRGGVRPNSGRKKGSVEAKTIARRAEKELMRERLREKVNEHFDPMVEAQISHAKGIKFLVLREKKTGKFTRIGKDKAELLVAADDDSLELVEVWEKDPNVQAFTDLLNRAIDKPTEQVNMQVSTDDVRVARLLAGRQRAAKVGE